VCVASRVGGGWPWTVSHPAKLGFVGYAVVIVMVILMVGDETIRNCGSQAQAQAVRQLCKVWRIITLGSDFNVNITVLGLRLGARRFIIAQYNRN
jgi:hypothetical protein